MCSNGTIKDRGVFTSNVIENGQLCDEHYRMVLRVDNFPACYPGQFVQLLCCPSQDVSSAVPVAWDENNPPGLSGGELVEELALLRRPFSLAETVTGKEGTDLHIIYRTVGRGTTYLSGVAEGSEISVLGPLGTPFPIPAAGKTAILVGGGVGIPPMICLAKELARQSIETVAFCGVRSQRLLFLSGGSEEIQTDGIPAMCSDEFQRHQIKTAISSDDGTAGYHGFVTDMISLWMDKNPANPADLVVYSCGPEPMMEAVADLCRAREVECYLSLERRMPCGMGTCQSCIVTVADDSEQGWSYKLCCKDGPVFDASTIRLSGV